jgi:hypothetical protein
MGLEHLDVARLRSLDPSAPEGAPLDVRTVAGDVVVCQAPADGDLACTLFRADQRSGRLVAGRRTFAPLCRLLDMVEAALPPTHRLVRPEIHGSGDHGSAHAPVLFGGSLSGLAWDRGGGWDGDGWPDEEVLRLPPGCLSIYPSFRLAGTTAAAFRRVEVELEVHVYRC